MAGFPTQMPGMESLVNTFGDLNPESYNMARQSFDLSRQFNEQNLVDQRMATEQQGRMNPLLVEQQQLNNRGKGISNDTNAVELQGKQRDWRVRQQIPEDNEVQAQMSKMATQISDDQFKQLETGIRSMALSADPATRQKGLAMMSNFQDFAKMREQHKLQHQGRMEEIGAQGANSKELMKMQIDAGRFDKSARTGGAIKDIWTKLQNEGDPIKRDALLRGAYSQAQALKDTEAMAVYEAMHQANYPAYQTAVATRGQAVQGKIDVPTMTGQPGVTPAQAAPPISQPQQQPSANPASHTMSDLKKMYPGKSDAELKAAYKAKFGVDPK